MPRGDQYGSLRLHLLPVDAVGRVSRRRGRTPPRPGAKRGHRLPADHPDLVLERQRVVQRPRPPGDGLALVDERPALAVGGVPDVGLVVPLVDVAADDPHLVLVDDVAGRVPALPVPRRVEGAVEEGVRLVERPRRAVGRAPDLVVADAREVLLVARVPAAEQPHPAVKDQRPGPVARGERGAVVHLHPAIPQGCLGGGHGSPRRCLTARTTTPMRFQEPDAPPPAALAASSRCPPASA